jgi:hypothetical protein
MWWILRRNDPVAASPLPSRLRPGSARVIPTVSGRRSCCSRLSRRGAVLRALSRALPGCRCAGRRDRGRGAAALSGLRLLRALDLHASAKILAADGFPTDAGKNPGTSGSRASPRRRSPPAFTAARSSMAMSRVLARHFGIEGERAQWNCRGTGCRRAPSRPTRRPSGPGRNGARACSRRGRCPVAKDAWLGEGRIVRRRRASAGAAAAARPGWCCRTRARCC